MKYLKRLKNELLDLTEKLTVKGNNPEYVSLKKATRLDVIPLIIALVQQARAIDSASLFDEPKSDWSAQRFEGWRVYLTNLKHWLGQAPKLSKEGEAQSPKRANLECKVSWDNDGYQVSFLNLRTSELQSIRNAIAIHSSHTLGAKDVLSVLLGALDAAGIIRDWGNQLEEPDKKPVEKAQLQS